MTSFSISWWVESKTWIKYWLEINIKSSQNVEIKYLSQVRRLISSTQVESEDWYWNSTQRSVYMQDDWFAWLFMIEFVNNNAISSSIKQSTFFLNKNFHSHMSFNSNSIEYKITWARIEAGKAENIFEHMKWSLALIKQVLIKVRVTMKKQIDKHWKKMIYKINDMMFLNSRNIMISRSSKKLDDKMLKLFKILIKIKHAYQLKLSSTMKIHSEFASNLLWLNSKNLLNEQWNESSDSIMIDDEDEWKMKNILNFRHYKRDKRLQYHVNWKEYDVNLHWYNVDESEFKECQKIINDFHEWYLNKSR